MRLLKQWLMPTYFDMLTGMFIELCRTFHELSESSESDRSDDRLLFAGGKDLGWSDLLKEHRVVILSEAGSGKTEEIRNIALQLRSHGKAAFFIRLEHVARDFEIAFEEGSYEEFQSWMGSDCEGWLLLDSVDEARLRNPSDFEAAIRRLGRLLTSAKQRVYITISSRASTWRPKTDLALCAKYLPFVKPSVTEINEEAANRSKREIRTVDTTKQGDEDIFKIVALDNLTSAQVEIFSKARGVANTDAFIDAVERADAWTFTSRPQDLEELVEFWKGYGRIGSRLELMRNSVDRRLSERDQDRAEAQPLSNERARLGASFVAATLIMAHESTIRIPDGAENMAGLPIKSILTDWCDGDCVTLLARPIFDEAIYGTVRFHHRSVREYLTAEWFAHLLKKETSRRRIEELFFREQYGLEVVVPVMRPILPWLAIFDEKIRDRIRRIAPEVLFEGGDPSQLPLETRRQILHQVCDQLVSGTSNRSMSDYAAVQRFANADLTSDIKNLICKFAVDDDLLWFLLRMVWQGELVGALPEALKVALSTDSGKYVRIAAFRAISAIGSIDDNASLRLSFQNESEILNREWLAELLNLVHPSAEVIEWLFECVRKVEDKNPHDVDNLTESFSEFVERTEIDALPLIIEQVSALLDKPPFIECRHCEVSTRYTWLLKGSALAIESMIRARDIGVFRPSCLSVIQKLALTKHFDPYGFGGLKLEMDELVPKWPELNLALFWYLVEQARKWLDPKKGERLTDSWNVGIWSSYVQFGASDFDLVLTEVTTRPFIDDRLIALSLAFRLYIDAGRQPQQRGFLKKAVLGDGTLSARLSEFMRPQPQSDEAKKFKMNAVWKRKSKQIQQRQQKNRNEWHRYLTEHVEKLRDPALKRPEDISSSQYYLHERMREGSSSSDRSEGNWQCLMKEFGDQIAQAFRDGAVAYWRRNKPKLVSEGAPRNSTPLSTVFGLTGLAIEAREVENWPEKINEEEAELAFRYAMHELNGFPNWLLRLFAKFPNIICQMVLHEIDYELSTEEETAESYYLLYDVSWNGDWLWDAIAPILFETVTEKEPENLKNIGYILNIIQGSSISSKAIAQVSSCKSKSLERLDHAAYWFAAWTGVEPDNAIPELEKRLTSITDDEQRTTFAMIYLTQLMGNRRNRNSGVREEYRTPHHLKLLYLLMHHYIRRAEDIERAGKGVYSPGLRDDAQEARDQIFALLKEMPGKDAFLALEEISIAHPDEQSRPWFKLYAKTKAELDADNPPWSPEQIREFRDEQERTPTNHRDLFDLAVMRLLDLKADLEDGDSSNASILRKIDDEIEIRKYVGNWCRESSRGRYSIPQEEELADAKRPDFRWHGNGFDAPVAMELKLADNWSGPSLFERMETQLCGDYLRDARSGRGIFLLVYRGDKHSWEPPGSSLGIDFMGLCQALQSHWAQISGAYSAIDDIRVIGIDLTKRSKLRIQ